MLSHPFCCSSPAEALERPWSTHSKFPRSRSLQCFGRFPPSAGVRIETPTDRPPTRYRPVRPSRRLCRACDGGHLDRRCKRKPGAPAFYSAQRKGRSGFCVPPATVVRVGQQHRRVARFGLIRSTIGPLCGARGSPKELEVGDDGHFDTSLKKAFNTRRPCIIRNRSGFGRNAPIWAIRPQLSNYRPRPPW
jgi:hypothetical protein